MSQLDEVIESIEERDNNIYRAYFNSSPIPEEQRKAGFGGVNRYKALEGYNNSELVINTTKRVDVLTKQLAIQSKSLDEIVALAKQKEKEEKYVFYFHFLKAIAKIIIIFESSFK